MINNSTLCRASTRALAAAAALCFVAAPALASEPAPERDSAHTTSFWHPWFEIGGYHNSRDDDSSDSTGTTGTNRGETTIFAPIRGGRRDLLFGQLTAKFFDDTAKEGNFALGYRRMMRSGFNLGAWIGGDVRRTGIDNTFWQLSGGLEVLSKNIDARLNWYGPVTKPQAGVGGGVASFAEVHLQDTEIFMTTTTSRTEEVGMKGIDGEIGFRLPTEHLSINPDRFELRAYGGGYHFTSDDADDDITGVKGRLELRVNDVIAALPGSRLTVDYEVSHDDVRDTRHDVGLRMRIPLNGNQPARSLASLSHQQRRMLDGIERDTDIVTRRRTEEVETREGVEDALTGVAFDKVAYATTDVTTTSNNAGANSLIILNGTAEGGQVLQAKQTLQGAGSTIQVRGRRSGTVAPFTAPDGGGKLVARSEDGNPNLLIDASHVHVSGITIDGRNVPVDSPSPSTAGILIEGAENDPRRNIFLTNLEITNLHGAGVDINNSYVNPETTHYDQVTILDSTISNVSLYGVSAHRYTELTVDSVSFSNLGTAIFLYQKNQAWLSNITVADISGDAVSMDSDNTVDISGLTVSGAAYGIYAEDDNTVTVTGSTFNDIRDDVFVSSAFNTWTIRNSVINGAGRYVFSIGVNEDWLIANNTINGNVGGSVFGILGDISEFLAGSTGNVLNATYTSLRFSTGTGLVGCVSFVDGTVVTDDPDSCP